MRKFMMILVLVAFAVMASATTVYDIQYTEEAGDGTYPSPLVDTEVTVTGIVAAANYGGDGKFFLTDPEGGAWSGIFVYDFEVGPALGDEVEVTGTVVEYYGLSEISYCTITILSSGNTVPAPIQISALNLVIPAQAEQYEGCLVQIDGLEVTEGQDDHGQWYVEDATGECQVDDGFFYLDEVEPAIVIVPGTTYARIIGCVDYSYDEYAIHPRTPEDLITELNNDSAELELNVTLGNNFPNPFNPTTYINYSLTNSADVKLVVFNTKGQIVKTLVNEIQTAGTHTVVWNGTSDRGDGLTSGIYFYNIKSGRFTSTKKMILLK